MPEVQVLRPADGAAGDARGQAVGEQPRASGRQHPRAADGGRPHEGLPSRRPQGPRGHLPPTWRPYARLEVFYTMRYYVARLKNIGIFKG